jgi:hypothetical protein
VAQPRLTTKPAEGLQDTALALEIKVVAGDPDDSLAIRVGPLPRCSALTTGHADPTRVWSLTAGELVGLRFVPAPGASGSMALAVQVDETDAAGQTSSASATLDIQVTALSDEALRGKLKEAFVPARRWQRWLTGNLLILGSVVIVSLWFTYIDEAQDLAVKEYSIAWEQPEGTVLASDGPSFWYDRANKILRHRGAIDAERKQELLRLLSLAAQAPRAKADESTPTGNSQGAEAQGAKQANEAKAPANPTPQAEDVDNPSTQQPKNAPAQSGIKGGQKQDADQGDQDTGPPAKPSETIEAATANQPAEDPRILGYKAAIDALTYRSLSDAGLYFMVLLIVAGLSGAVGVQVRATINFVRIACFHNLLDIRRWWPWYLLRPAAGLHSRGADRVAGAIGAFHAREHIDTRRDDLVDRDRVPGRVRGGGFQ